MSTIAKIFTILNLVLAAAFLGWAANAVNTNTEWKAKYEKEEAAHNLTRADMGKEKSTLVADKASLNTTIQSFKDKTEGLENEKKRLEDDLKAAKSKNQDIDADVKRLATTLESISNDKKMADGEREKANIAATQAEKAKNDALAAQKTAEASASSLTDELAKAKSAIADGEKEIAKLDHEKKSVETQLATVVSATGFKIGDLKAMPLIEGKILAVNTDVKPGLVSINKGASDGVQPGFTFEIYEGSTYKGQARVEYVYPNMCSAIMIRTNEKAPAIRTGDGASTRIG